MGSTGMFEGKKMHACLTQNNRIIAAAGDSFAQIGDIKDEIFSGSCSPCRNYYKAINMVFDAYKVRIDNARHTLAAFAAHNAWMGSLLLIILCQI